MQLFLPLAMIFVAQGFYCDRSVLSHHAAAVVQRGAHNQKESDWKAIASLTNRAYSEYDRNNKPESRRLFAEAADKLEAYLRKYETNSGRLSYLRVLVHLGALYQNADNLSQARIVFEQCERHQEFNSRAATLRVMGNGREVEESIANYVEAQLCFLTNCSKPEYKAAHDIVRITGGGSSRGDEIAPPFSLPTRKRHRHTRSRSPA